MSETPCIYCGTALEQDPERPHWQHCPKCSPAWTEHSSRLRRLFNLDKFAQFAASFPKGRPTIGGSRK
jgi:hypothetical protein